jgi:hypothetical protein
MVSAEGACAAYYQYGRYLDTLEGAAPSAPGAGDGSETPVAVNSRSIGRA